MIVSCYQKGIPSSVDNGVLLADAGAVLHGSLHVRSMLQSGFGVGDAVGRPVHEVQTTMKTGYKRCRREGSVMPGRAQRCTQRLP